MKWRTFEVQRERGFRFNLIDLLLMAAVAVVTVLGACFFPDNRLYLLPLYVGVSFFLFCNVFRIGNRLEAYWYVPFVVVTVLALRDPSGFWWIVLGICEPLRVAVVACSIQTGTYRGVFSRSK
jgi:hypothetical protein